MPNRDWRVYGAIAGVIIAAGLSGWWLWEYKQDQAQQRQEAARDDAEGAEQQWYYSCFQLSGIVDRVSCIASQISRESPDKTAQHDLNAQQDMATWALGVFITSIFSVFLTTAGVILIWRTLYYTKDAAESTRIAAEASKAAVEESRKATEAAAKSVDVALEGNKINREIFVSDQRPWLFASVRIADALTWDRNGANFGFVISVKNTGRTPAVNSETRFKLYADLSIDPLTAQRALADEPEGSSPWRTTIFPGDTVIQSISITISPAELGKVRKRWIKTNGEDRTWLTPVIVGCVLYENLFTGNAHQTGFIYLVKRTVAVKNSVIISPEVGAIPSDHLGLERWFQSGRVD